MFSFSQLHGKLISDINKKLDVPDNFKKYKTKTIPKNIILSKSKYDLKTRYYSKNLLYFDVISTS